MLADHPVQRLVGGFSFTNKILLLSSPAHHGWLGLITYGYVGVKTSAHPFPMRLEPTLRLAIHECSLHRYKLSLDHRYTCASGPDTDVCPIPLRPHQYEEQHSVRAIRHQDLKQLVAIAWGLTQSDSARPQLSHFCTAQQDLQLGVLAACAQRRTQHKALPEKPQTRVLN